MFFAKVRNDDNELNGIEIERLKNKLGTNQLPTAEILLDGMIAYRVVFKMNIKIKYLKKDFKINA